jgi:hypothetical protein
MSNISSRGRGRPKFEATDEQRRFVAVMAGVRMSHEELRLLIVNPQTGKPVDVRTLEREFAPELAAGKARLQMLTRMKLHEAICAGMPWAIIFALQHIDGWSPTIR